MAALIRYGLRKSHFIGQQISASSLLHKTPRAQLYLPLVESARCVAAVQGKRRDPRIAAHERLDRNQGISTDLFKDLFSFVEKEGLTTEHDVNLLLHICSMGPFDASTSDRVEYAERIWRRFEESSVQPTSKLYNMKLKAYCSNDKVFSPVDELARMKSLGINPDKVTYGLLIEGFCRSGDVAGANHVLEAMNDAQLLIEVSVFNSFITGHLKNGSIDEATRILETLRSRGLKPNSDTYYRFIQHYAEEGDVKSVIKYINDAGDAGLLLDQNALMKVYTLMLRAGHGEEASQIIPMMIERDVFNRGTVNNLCQLVAEGFSNEALNIYLNIPLMTEMIPSHAGTFLLQCMILNNHDAQDILDTTNRLSEAHPQTNPHNIALMHAFKRNKHELGVELIDEMMSQKQDVRLTHILPALCGYRNAGDVEGVYKTVNMILSLEPCEDTHDAIEMFCYPALKNMGQSDEDIMGRMKEHEAKWNTFFMITELKTKGFTAALESASEKSLDNGLVSWITMNKQVLGNHLPEQRESCVKLLARLIKENNLKKQVVIFMVRSRLGADDPETVHSLLDTFKQEDIKLPPQFLGYQDVTKAPQDIQDKFKELCRVQTFPGGMSMEELNAKSKEELEGYVKRFPRYLLARFALLNKTLLEKNLSDIHKRLRELKAMNLTLSRVHLIKVINTLSGLGDVETASIYFKELQERFPNQYSDTLPIALAVMNVKDGNIQDALEMIETAKKSELKNIRGREVIRRRSIVNMLNATKTMEDMDSIHEALVKGDKFLTGLDLTLAHHHYILKALDSDDDDHLVQRLTQLRDRHWVFPCMDRVIIRLIQKQDIQNIKKVMDLGVSVVGNNLFQHKLACNFISCDMPSKAAAVFQKMGGTLNQRLLESNCKYYIKHKEIKNVETLVEVVKDLPVSRAFMLKQLIEAYVRTNAFDKAMEVLEMHESEFLVPRNAALDILEAYCKEHQMEHPETLKGFLSKRDRTDESKPQDMETSSDSDSDSSSSSSSDSESESDSVVEGKPESDTSHTPQPLAGTTDTKST